MKIIGKGVDALKKFIKECLDAGGIPTFVAEYGGVSLKDKVIARCYLARAKVPGGVIEDLPPDLVEEIRRRRNDWKWLAEKLGITV